MSVFFKDDSGKIYHTYSSFSRGAEQVLGTYALLDMLPKGRDEEPFKVHPMECKASMTNISLQVNPDAVISRGRVSDVLFRHDDVIAHVEAVYLNRSANRDRLLAEFLVRDDTRVGNYLRQ